MDNEKTFVIETDHTADWAVKSIRETERERDRLISIAQCQIDDLNAQIEDIKTKYNKKTAFLKSCLYDYMEKVPHKKTKTQESYQLLSGKLVLVKETQKLVPGDKLVDYLKNNEMSNFVKVKESVDWANVKKLLVIKDGVVINSTTGEIVDADIVKLEDVPASFNVKFDDNEEVED